MIRTDRWQLTPEPFGGLLVNVATFDEYEIGVAEYLFVKLRLLGYAANCISQEMKVRLGAEYGVPAELVSLFSDVETNARSSDFDRDCQEAMGELEAAQTRNHLSVPTEVTIYPTMKCQLSCEFCFVKERLSKRDTDLPSKDWIKLCGELVDMGVRSISVLGGEPLMYREISDLLAGLNDLNVRVTFTSNGQHVKSTFIDGLEKWSNVKAVFSLHTLSTRSKFVMGSHYDPWRTVTSMSNVRERGLPCRMNTVLTDQSDEELAELEGLSRSLGVEKWSIAYPYSNPPLLSVSKFLETTDRVISLSKRNHSKTYISPEGCMIFSSNEMGHADIGKLSKYQELTYGCEAGQSILEIGPQGQMYPCASMMNEDRIVGNAFTDNWLAVWRDSPQLGFLRNIKAPTYCKSCALVAFCKGGCPAWRKTAGIPLADRDARCEVAL